MPKKGEKPQVYKTCWMELHLTDNITQQQQLESHSAFTSKQVHKTPETEFTQDPHPVLQSLPFSEQ